ncbi:MAG: hypothetical protein AABO58_14965 [Acidobacteriota bacterium]
MADKILRVIFNGISTLHPGPPRKKSEPPPKKAFVLMAANREERQNDWDATVEPHFPFVYVPLSLLGGLISDPAEWVDDEKFGRCYIYYLENARVVFDPPPLPGVHYYMDEKHGLGERPGSDDVANEHDIRWLADIRDLLPKHVQLKSDPSAPGPEVAAVVELSGGTLRAGFSCKSVQPKTFKAANGKTVPRLKRVLATEFSIDMSYPETTPQVKLQLRPLRMDAPITGISVNELVLRWPEKGPLVVRMGNDTKLEARLATSFKRCDARARTEDGRPLLRPRDDDFFLHYDLLNIPGGVGRPLPQAGPHQTSGDGCKPAKS